MKTQTGIINEVKEGLPPHTDYHRIGVGRGSSTCPCCAVDTFAEEERFAAIQRVKNCKDCIEYETWFDQCIACQRDIAYYQLMEKEIG